MLHPGVVIVLIVVGVLFVCAGVVMPLGRRRVAANMRDAGIVPGWNSPMLYAFLVAAGQIVMGSMFITLPATRIGDW